MADDDTEMVVANEINGHAAEDLTHIAWVEANHSLERTRLVWYLSRQTETVDVDIVHP